MDACIYWEKQDSDALCAVYALNCLLQGPYFDAVVLAQIGNEIDQQETELFSRQSANANVGESGYYSIQVIAKALESQDLDCEYYSTQLNNGAQPASEEAFICNREEH